MGRIIGTPFSSRNLRVLEKTNMRIGDLIKGANISKELISKKNLRDKIESNPLPQRRPGAIE